MNQTTGEVINSSDIKAFIDFDKVAEYRKSMGYYQIVTSELTMDPLEVIDKYHGLTQIEDQFRVMKGDLDTRPFYVRTPEHVDAHMLICMISLILLRIIQKRILGEDQFRVMKGDLDTRPFYVRTPEHVDAHMLICMISLILLRIIQKRILGSGLIHVDEEAYWNTGLNSERIQKALNKWKVDTLPGDLYRFMDVDDPDLKLILDAFDIKIPAKLYSERIQKALNKWKVDTLPGDLYRFMDVDDPDLKLILDAFDIKIPAKLYRRSELKRIKTDTRIFI